MSGDAVSTALSRMTYQGVEPGPNSRTSCAQRQATAILPAHSSACSREGTSTTENPPIYALLSGYGPSMTVLSVATTLTASWGTA